MTPLSSNQSEILGITITRTSQVRISVLVLQGITGVHRNLLKYPILAGHHFLEDHQSFTCIHISACRWTTDLIQTCKQHRQEAIKVRGSTDGSHNAANRDWPVWAQRVREEHTGPKVLSFDFHVTSSCCGFLSVVLGICWSSGCGKSTQAKMCYSLMFLCMFLGGRLTHLMIGQCGKAREVPESRILLSSVSLCTFALY